MVGRASLLIILATIIVSGCDNKNEGTVSGSVTIDGVAPKEGAIDFIPADGQSRTAGTAITDGRYEAHVPVGKMVVEIRVSKIVGQRKLYNTPDSPTQPILEQMLPPKYNSQSELQLDVKPGDNHKDYQLTTK